MLTCKKNAGVCKNLADPSRNMKTGNDSRNVLETNSNSISLYFVLKALYTLLDCLSYVSVLGIVQDVAFGSDIGDCLS